MTVRHTLLRIGRWSIKFATRHPNRPTWFLHGMSTDLVENGMALRPIPPPSALKRFGQTFQRRVKSPSSTYGGDAPHGVVIQSVTVGQGRSLCRELTLHPLGRASLWPDLFPVTTFLLSQGMPRGLSFELQRELSNMGPGIPGSPPDRSFWSSRESVMHQLLRRGAWLRFRSLESMTQGT